MGLAPGAGSEGVLPYMGYLDVPKGYVLSRFERKWDFDFGNFGLNSAPLSSNQNNLHYLSHLPQLGK